MNLLEKKVDELRAINVDENTIKHVLKEYGIERFIKFYLFIYLLVFIIYVKLLCFNLTLFHDLI